MEVTVIDVGCGPVPGSEFNSIQHICNEFHPAYAIGLDPRADSDCYSYEDTLVITLPVAAWIERGTINFVEQRTGSFVTLEESYGEPVPCVDLAALVRRFAPVILKIDAEGAEWPLLDHLLKEHVGGMIRMAWIEWHDASTVSSTPEREREKDRLISELTNLGVEYAEWKL